MGMINISFSFYCKKISSTCKMIKDNCIWHWHWGDKRERQGSYQTTECMLLLRVMITTAVPAITATFPASRKKKWGRERKVKGL